MVSDQEPRYRLVDSDGNIVGSLYGKPDGSVAIQETDSGSDREVALAPDGTFSAPSVETESVSTDERTTNKPGTKLTRDDTQAIDANTETKVEWQSAEFDTLDMGRLANNEIQVPTDGFYYIRGSVGWADNVDGERYDIMIKVNGSTVRQLETRASGASKNAIEAASTEMLDAGDVIDIRVDHTGSDGDRIDTGDERNNFEVIRL